MESMELFWRTVAFSESLHIVLSDRLLIIKWKSVHCKIHCLVIGYLGCDVKSSVISALILPLF